MQTPNVKKNIKVLVLARNGDGAPEFFKALVNVSPAQWEEGDYYDLAIEQAKDAGYSGNMIAFTKDDPAGQQLGQVLVWL